MREIKLPFRYLSYSQFSTWVKSRSQYWGRYVYGERMFETGELLFGRRFADYMETGDKELALDFTMEGVRDLMIKLDHTEARHEVEYKGVPLLIKCDAIKEDMSHFVEYKTGKDPWVQERVNTDDQMLFYTSAIWLITGEIPRGTLQWAESEDVEPSVNYPEGIRLTGNVATFEMSRETPRDSYVEAIEAFLDHVVTVAWQISEVWRQHEGDWEEVMIQRDPFLEYRNLERRKKEIQEQMKGLQPAIKRELELANLQLFEVPGAAISMTEKGNISIKLKK